MTGRMGGDENIRKLRRVTAASSAEQVRLSSGAWLKNAAGLDRLAAILETTAREVERGFSDGVDGDPDGTAATGSAAFLLLRERVLFRRDQMDRAGTVLTTASERLDTAEKARLGVPENPGEPPKEPSPYGAQDDGALARAQRAYSNAKARHDTRAAAYANADEQARVVLLDLDVAYKEAADALAEIHATEVDPDDLEIGDEDERPGVNPRLVGAVGAGALAGPGLVRGLRALRGGALPSGPVRPVGTTNRAAGASTLGRGSGATPGAPVGRGGAGGGRGMGGIGAMGAGRGRTRKEARSSNPDRYDDGQDWVDDEDAGPGVLS